MQVSDRKYIKTCLKGLLTVAFSLLFIFAGQGVSYSQNRKKDKNRFNQAVEYKKDSIVLSDSLRAIRDSLHRADSLFKIDSAEMQKHSSLDFPAFSTAKDSVVDVFSNGRRIRRYYGDVSVTYGDMTLKSEFMEYDMKTGIVYAAGIYDSIKQEWKGLPEMTQGRDTYKMEELRYNFNTRKARITNMITQQDEGLLQGTKIKMLPDKSINIRGGQYTVCDLEEPHYYLYLTSARTLTKPSRKTVFGPSWPVIEGVPLPIAIPFGFIPKRPSRATGLLMPTFGEESARGFYLRDLGMYFVFGDHLDLSVTGDYYTLGSWGLDINSRYKVNYKFNGNFSIILSNDQTGLKGSTDFFQTRNFSVKWSHSQDAKFIPGTTFSASVNFSSPSNNRYNSRSITEALQNQASSSVSFSRNWNGKYNLSVNMLHSQNSRDSSYTFTLPNITFSVSRFYPFKRKVRAGKEKIYEKISFAYNTTLQNKVAFKSSEFMKDDFMNKFQNGMTHSFNIGLPSFSVLKYLNVNPSVTYGMNWFFKKNEYEYNPETDKVELVEGKQFGHFGATHNYSFAMSASTRIYGTLNFGRNKKIQAIRHVISPSFSLSFSPDKAKSFNGYRTLYYTDASGADKEYQYNIYSGQLYSPPGKGKSATASISIGNNFEAKVRDLRDTTGKGVKKVKLIDQLNISTGYNFLADSLRLNNIGVTMSTNIFEKVGINANANFDPYAIDYRGRKYNKLYAAEKGLLHLARLTSLSASVSFSLAGKGEYKGNDGSKTGGSDGNPTTADYYRRIYYHPITGEYIPGGWLYYTNPNVPWSMNFSYNFSYNKTYQYTNNQLIAKKTFLQTVNLTGNIQVTPKLALNAISNIDLTAMKITTTQLSATYDLHCFNIAVQWVPMGNWQSWSFRISANASALADLLKYRRSSSFWDR